MARDSTKETFIVTLVLGVSCSLLISVAAVGLRGFQEVNQARSVRTSILTAAGLLQGKAKADEVDARFEAVETRIVDLDAGTFVTDDPGLVPGDFDQRAAARDPDLSKKIDRPADLAGIGRRERYSNVYLIKDGESVDQIVLPIYGKGLFSTLYGFLALDGDLETVRGITYYEHGETPGLGAEVERPDWQALWKGKRLFDDQGAVALHLVKGHVDPSAPGAEFEVDAISGATLTSNGVTAMVQYWLGDDGFGPLLDQMRSGGAEQALLVNGHIGHAGVHVSDQAHVHPPEEADRRGAVAVVG